MSVQSRYIAASTTRRRRAVPGALLGVAFVLAGCHEQSQDVVPTPGAQAESTATEAAIPAPQNLSVEGSAFVLRLEDGRVLRGTELQGATLYLSMGEDQVLPVRLDRVEADPDQGDLLRHDFRVEDEQHHWVPLCSPNAAGESWGFPIVLPEGHPGREHDITLTCVSGAVGKCARFGYKPWARGPGGEDLLPYHAACVHMVRADYAGDGEPHTRDGTSIDIYDRLGIQQSESANDPGYAFEAGWTPAGAVCVARTRWPDLVSLDQLRSRHPGRFGGDKVCDDETARALGALLFNRSRRQ